MAKLIYTPIGLVIFFIRCIMAFSFTVFWFIPAIRLNLNQDGWLTFWFLFGIILILCFKFIYKGEKE